MVDAFPSLVHDKSGHSTHAQRLCQFRQRIPVHDDKLDPTVIAARELGYEAGDVSAGAAARACDLEDEEARCECDGGGEGSG